MALIDPSPLCLNDSCIEMFSNSMKNEESRWLLLLKVAKDNYEKISTELYQLFVRMFLV